MTRSVKLESTYTFEVVMMKLSKPPNSKLHFSNCLTKFKTLSMLKNSFATGKLSVITFRKFPWK